MNTHIGDQSIVRFLNVDWACQTEDKQGLTWAVQVLSNIQQKCTALINRLSLVIKHRFSKNLWIDNQAIVNRIDRDITYLNTLMPLNLVEVSLIVCAVTRIKQICELMKQNRIAIDSPFSEALLQLIIKVSDQETLIRARHEEVLKQKKATLIAQAKEDPVQNPSLTPLEVVIEEPLQPMIEKEQPDVLRLPIHPIILKKASVYPKGAMRKYAGIFALLVVCGAALAMRKGWLNATPVPSQEQALKQPSELPAPVPLPTSASSNKIESISVFNQVHSLNLSDENCSLWAINEPLPNTIVPRRKTIIKLHHQRLQRPKQDSLKVGRAFPPMLSFFPRLFEDLSLKGNTIVTALAGIALLCFGLLKVKKINAKHVQDIPSDLRVRVSVLPPKASQLSAAQPIVTVTSTCFDHSTEVPQGSVSSKPIVKKSLSRAKELLDMHSPHLEKEKELDDATKMLLTQAEFSNVQDLTPQNGIEAGAQLNDSQHDKLFELCAFTSNGQPIEEKTYRLLLRQELEKSFGESTRQTKKNLLYAVGKKTRQSLALAPLINDERHLDIQTQQLLEEVEKAGGQEGMFEEQHSEESSGNNYDVESLIQEQKRLDRETHELLQSAGILCK